MFVQCLPNNIIITITIVVVSDDVVVFGWCTFLIYSHSHTHTLRLAFYTKRPCSDPTVVRPETPAAGLLWLCEDLTSTRWTFINVGRHHCAWWASTTNDESQVNKIGWFVRGGIGVRWCILSMCMLLFIPIWEWVGTRPECVWSWIWVVGFEKQTERIHRATCRPLLTISCCVYVARCCIPKTKKQHSNNVIVKALNRTVNAQQ